MKELCQICKLVRDYNLKLELQNKNSPRKVMFTFNTCIKIWKRSVEDVHSNEEYRN